MLGGLSWHLSARPLPRCGHLENSLPQPSPCSQLPAPCFSEVQPLPLTDRSHHFPNRSCQGLCPHREWQSHLDGDHPGLVCRQWRYFIGSISGASQNQKPEPGQERGQEPRQPGGRGPRQIWPWSSWSLPPRPPREGLCMLLSSLEPLQRFLATEWRQVTPNIRGINRSETKPMPEASGLDIAGEMPEVLSC